MRILFCHGLGSSVRNRISQQLTGLFEGTGYHFEPVLYPKPNPAWSVSKWLAAVESRLDNETIIVAQSAGAHPALNAALRNGDKVKGLFLVSPGYDVDFSYVDKTCISTRPGTIPISCPVTVVHGTEDELVPYGNSIRLLMSLQSAHLHMNTVPGGTHFLSMDDAVVREEFLKFCEMMGISVNKPEPKKAAKM